MKKGLVTAILFAVVSSVLTLSVFAHSHIAQEKWKKDSVSHWKLCSCGEKLGKESHFDTDGDEICDACLYFMKDTGLSVDFGSVKAVSGETASVDITVSGNPGIAGLDIKLDFDRENLSIKEIIYYGWKATDNLAYCGDGRNLSLLFYKTANVSTNGVLATLVFEVAEDATIGEYPIEITFIEATDEETNDVYLSAQAATVFVGGSIAGDVNSDGEVNIRDCIALAQYLAGWEASIDIDAADCNSDGEVTIKDIILLAQYLAGWNVTLG